MTGITYSYYYDNPTDVDTYVKVICQAAPSSGISLQIKQAVWDNFNGADDSKAITIGDTVYAGRFFSALAGLDVDIVQIQVSKSSDSGYANYLDFDMDELPVLGDRPTSDTSPSNIIIEVAS